MHFYQRTLSYPIMCTGIGLHSGQRVNLCLRPAEPDTGIIFKRIDKSGFHFIPADVYHVVDTCFSTTIGNNGLTISTVEHLLSALAGMGIDNVIIEVDASELPIMDGSAAPFIFLIKNTGVTSQARPRQFYKVRREIVVKEKDKKISVVPADQLIVDFTIKFDHPIIRRQRMGFFFNERNYVKEISRARTFGFLSDIQKLHKQNLGLGGSLENAIIIDNYRVLNDDGLRYPDEFIRHKVLDFIGDLALLGHPVLGAFTVFKSGHKLNNQLFCRLLDDPQALQLIIPNFNSTQKEMISDDNNKIKISSKSEVAVA